MKIKNADGEGKAHNKCVQSDSARVVHLCAARCAPFVAYKWPTHALRLTQALCEKERREKTLAAEINILIQRCEHVLPMKYKIVYISQSH